MYYLRLERIPKDSNGKLDWNKAKKLTKKFNTIETARKYLMNELYKKTYIDADMSNDNYSPKGYGFIGNIYVKKFNPKFKKYQFFKYEQIMFKKMPRGYSYYEEHQNNVLGDVINKILPNGKLDTQRPYSNIKDKPISEWW